MTEEELMKAFGKYAARDLDGALVLITGLFVGICEVCCEIRGVESGKTINIAGMAGERPITIHPARNSVH